MKKWYDKEEDIIGLQLANGEYWKSIELPNGVVIDISKDGQIIGIEIHNAKQVFSGEARKVLQAAITS